MRVLGVEQRLETIVGWGYFGLFSFVHVWVTETIMWVAAVVAILVAQTCMQTLSNRSSFLKVIQVFLDSA